MKRDDNRNQKIDNEVAKTIASLNELDNIEVGPYFFTRLQANLENASREKESPLIKILLGSKLAPSLLGLVFVINILTVMIILKDRKIIESDIRNENMEILVDEYLSTGTSTNIDFVSK